MEKAAATNRRSVLARMRVDASAELTMTALKLPRLSHVIHGASAPVIVLTTAKIAAATHIARPHQNRGGNREANHAPATRQWYTLPARPGPCSALFSLPQGFGLTSFCEWIREIDQVQPALVCHLVQLVRRQIPRLDVPIEAEPSWMHATGLVGFVRPMQVVDPRGHVVSGEVPRADVCSLDLIRRVEPLVCAISRKNSSPSQRSVNLGGGRLAIR